MDEEPGVSGLLLLVPLSGKGRPKECWQRTNSAPSASLFSTGVPIRVMMPMLATTYGESVTLKENATFTTVHCVNKHKSIIGGDF